MLELGRLRALAGIARYGTVLATAQALRCTPSAVSQHLTKLERETGSKLVERDGRRLRLTEAGRVLSAHALRVLAAVEEAEAALAAHLETVSGRLAIGAFPTACRALLPHTLKSLNDTHPQLRAALRECDPHIGLDLVLRGELDLAVVDDWLEVPIGFPPGVSHSVLGLDVADLVAPAGHRVVARTGPVRRADVAGERWIASTPGTVCHQWLLRILPGVEPDILVAEFETQLTLVAAGLGVAIVPRLARAGTPQGTAVVPITPTPARRVVVAWRSAASVRPAIAAAIAALHDAWSATPR